MEKGIIYIRTSGIYDDSRASKEILSLAKAGYRILVIGWDKDGKSNKKCEEIFADYDVQFRFYNRMIEGGIGFKGLPFLFGFMRFAYNIMKTRNKEFSCIHACDLDAGIPAFRFCKKYRIKLIYDIYDYYVDTHFVPGVVKKIVEKMEIEVINYADVTVICTEERKEQISSSTPRKVVVIHNSPDISKEQACCADELYDYVYCGALSEMRLLEEIIEEYKNNQDMKILFAGSGRLTENVMKAKKENLNFEFVDALPYKEVLEYESKARVLSAIYEPTIRNHRLCAPNKFYESLALMKPIIVCKGTGIDRIVEEYKIGVVIDYDASQFYEALKYLLENETLRHEMGKRARELYEEKYRWSLMEENLIATYNGLVER